MTMDHHLSNEELLEILRARLLKNEVEAPNLELIHELERMSARLRASEQLKSNFLSHVRNELINPVTSILGLSRHIAQDQLASPSMIRHQARLLYREAFHLDFQTRNIIAAAEIEAGEVYPLPVKLNPRKIIDNIVTAFGHKAQAKNIGLEVTEAETKYTVVTDSYMMSVIIANLLANAIEYSANGTKVAIHIQQNDNHLSCSIKDTGAGIDPKDHDRLFDRFSQLNEGCTRTHTGLGLGLSIVSEFAEALRGTIHIQSAVGNGSIFTVTLPSLEHADDHTSGEWNEVLFGDEKVF
jgi:signal transduction histidine kinase